MSERDRFNRLLHRLPHPHAAMTDRPHLSRRQFFRSVTAGLGGYYLVDRIAGGEARAAGGAAPKGTAKNCIFLFMSGAPSHVDTFDFKLFAGVTPNDFQPETVNGRLFPVGLMPNTAQVLDKIAVIRSGLAWAVNHRTSQTWMQIGRNPTSATGRIAPHIGSVVAIEKEPERRPDQIFPAFIAFNPRNTAGQGYFPTQFGPFMTVPSSSGLANTDHPPGEARFNQRWELLQSLDGSLRAADSPLGATVAGMGKLYDGARGLMFNPVVSSAFSFTEEESVRYGSTSFGNACLLARKILQADQGTRFIQVTLGRWDHHQNIYQKQEVDGRFTGNNLYSQAGQELDPAYAALIQDLDSAGLLEETLIVLVGEFGRTVGPLTAGRNGRDHHRQMFYALAGGGVQGGKLIGATNDTGSFTIDPGWSRGRDIRPEDLEATIYSALGIDWTIVRDDDPLGRGFPYVPLASEDAYAPIDELWQA